MSDNQARGWLWTDTCLPAVLLGIAAVCWWWCTVNAAGMRGDAMSMDTMSTMSCAAFLIVWAATMLPAVLPVVRRYARAADGNAVPAQ